MTTLLEPTIEGLRAERDELLAHVRASETELRERCVTGHLTVAESAALRRLDEIAFLLGED